jgi:IS5 family transposase
MVEKPKIKQEFFNQIIQPIDWRPVSNSINKQYQKGESALGRPSYEGIVLFKMMLLQT